MVSIIIPAYNASAFIEHTIKSVLEQTYLNWELLIVNDGSSDDTTDKIAPFLSNRITLFSQENKGVSAARNLGIYNAKGDYIAFLDADDYWLPDNLQLKMDCININNCDFVFSDFVKCNETLQEIEKGPIGTDENMLDKLLLWEQDVIPGASSNLLLKRKCFETGLSFDSNFSTAADQDFCLYLTQKFKGKHIRKFTWCYRVYSTSMSRNVVVLTKDHTGVYEKARKNGLFKSWLFKQKCFSNMYLIMAGNWWINAGNKSKALKFMVLSVFFYPLNGFKILKKLI